MNFIEEFKKGQTGGNKGLYMGKGLETISRALGGLQRARYHAVASPPKTGKSTFVNYGYIIQPYLYALEYNIEVEWIYLSLEMDRISQEFDFSAYFLHHDFGITHITLPEGVTKDGLNEIPLSSAYLRGRIQDDNDKTIKVKETVEEALKETYTRRIIPLFGEYSSSGRQMSKGKILFISDTDNPTGIYKSLLKHAESNGKLIKSGPKQFERITGFKPKNPEKFTIVILDHIRKLIPERGMQMKQTVDKMSEYFVILRNLLGYTFVSVVHLNRSIVSSERFKQFGDLLHPTSEDVKDSGNIAEDCDYMFTMFDPNDLRYNLKQHFGVELRDRNGNEIYPHLKTVHLVESRHTEYPQHFKVNMKGNLKSFEQLKTE